jgi:hypothetical protein
VKDWLNEKRASAPFHESFSAEAVAELLRGQAPSDIKDKLQQAVNAGVGRIITGEGEDKVMLSDLQAVI